MIAVSGVRDSKLDSSHGIIDEVQLHRSGSTRSNTCQRSSSNLNVLGHCASTDTDTTDQFSLVVDRQPSIPLARRVVSRTSEHSPSAKDNKPAICLLDGIQRSARLT